MSLAACGGTVIGSEQEGGSRDGSKPPLDTGHPDVQDADLGDGADAEVGVETGPDVAPPKGLVTIPLSGCVPEYTAKVQIGGSQTFQLVIDTGSTTLGVASSSCAECSGISPRYTPGASAVDQHLVASSTYESGNSWSGEIFQDSVGLGTPSATATVKLAAIDKQSTFFQPITCGSTLSPYQGIIGFAPSASAVTGTDGYFDDLVGEGFAPDLFATQLCDSGGFLWLGGYDPTHVTAPVQYVPASPSFLSAYSYVVDLAQITIGTTSVPLASGGYADSILDTGTSEFVLNTTAFDAVTAAITSDSTFQSTISTDPMWFNDPSGCVVLSQTKAELDAALPTMTLVYGSSPSVSIVAVATESYLFNYAGYWCPALASTDPGPYFPLAAIIGSPVLKSSVTVFDRAGRRFGFAPHAPCP